MLHDYMLMCSQKLKARIIIAWIPHSVAVNFWCQVSYNGWTTPVWLLKSFKVIRNRLAGPDFVWILPGWLRPNWWAEVDNSDCTADEMSRALEHSISGTGNGILDNDPSRTLISTKVGCNMLLPSSIGGGKGGAAAPPGFQSAL